MAVSCSSIDIPCDLVAVDVLDQHMAQLVSITMINLYYVQGNVNNPCLE